MRGATVNSLDYEGQPTVVGSSQSIRRPSNNLSAKFGFNQTFGSLSFGAWYKVLREDGHFSNHGSEWLDDNPLIERNITKRISGTNHYSQYYLDKSFASGGRIHFDGSLIDRNTRSATTTAYTLSDLYPDVSSTQRYDSRLYAGKLTYSMPLSKGSLVVGTEDSYTTTRVDYRMLNEEIGSYIPSALSEVAQTSLAGFASYSAGFGKLGLTAGLRYEYKTSAIVLTASVMTVCRVATILSRPTYRCPTTFPATVRSRCLSAIKVSPNYLHTQAFPTDFPTRGFMRSRVVILLCATAAAISCSSSA